MVERDTSLNGQRATRERTVERVLIFSITVVAAVLLLSDLGGKCLWGDEMNMVWFATGVRDLQLTSGNAIGYLPLLRLIASVAPTDFALRLPAALFGIATVPLSTLLARCFSTGGSG